MTNITGYIYDERMAEHFHPYKIHPEQPERILAVRQSMEEHGLLSKCIKIPARHANKEEICNVHESSYFLILVDASKSEDDSDRIKIAKRFNSIYFNKFSLDAALLAAGGTIELGRAIMNKRVLNGFAIVRPPGHHAESHCAMGFCLFNNVAVAIAALNKEFGPFKVLILDWDVHHGNGTQEIFLQQSDVLYISIHRYEDANFYPHSEDANFTQVGIGKGVGKTVNIPWSDCGMGDADYIYVFNRIVLPIAYEFSPDLVIVSAGFDAAVGDPIGECMVTPDGFAQMTHMLMGLANGKIMLVMEGGYDLDSLSLGATSCMKVLLGGAPPRLDFLVPSQIAINTANSVVQTHSAYWKCFGLFYADPSFGGSVRMVSVSSLLTGFWSHWLEEAGSMCRLPINNGVLRRYEKNVHISDNALHSPDVLLFIIHSGDYMRTKHSFSNCINPSQTSLVCYLFFFSSLF